MTVNVLIIGYGSIGAQHARLVTRLGSDVAVLSHRRNVFPKTYLDLAQALHKHTPDYVVIANATNEHYGTLCQLSQLGYTGTVLVEKPIFSRLETIPAMPFKAVFIAYNLRFHPINQRIKSLLRGERILSVQAYVGQYLQDWRPSVDYRKSYSASTARGGGALRDLSHELDYLMRILGGWEKVTALGGQFSQMEIDSDDVYTLLLSTPKCPVVSIQLNYLDRRCRRFFIINTDSSTIEADLISGALTINGQVESYPIDREHTYLAMHRAIQEGRTDTLCSLEDGLDVLRLIESAEYSATHHTWVIRRTRKTGISE
jgi:predicted dehydrogenase